MYRLLKLNELAFILHPNNVNFSKTKNIKYFTWHALVYLDSMYQMAYLL